ATAASSPGATWWGATSACWTRCSKASTGASRSRATCRATRSARQMANRMPREIAQGVFWIGDCLVQRHKGRIYHGYNAAFLVAGKEPSCRVEPGPPRFFPVTGRPPAELFARGAPPLKYLFVTHQETPHCGGLGRILKGFPDAVLCGDVSDYHLA